MNLALGIVFLFAGASLLYIGTRGTEATTPWGAFQTIIGRMRGEGADE